MTTLIGIVGDSRVFLAGRPESFTIPNGGQACSLYGVTTGCK